MYFYDLVTFLLALYCFVQQWGSKHRRRFTTSLVFIFILSMVCVVADNLMMFCRSSKMGNCKKKRVLHINLVQFCHLSRHSFKLSAILLFKPWHKYIAYSSNIWILIYQIYSYSEYYTIYHFISLNASLKYLELMLIKLIKGILLRDSP